jgi:hypothetical protein
LSSHWNGPVGPSLDVIDDDDDDAFSLDFTAQTNLVLIS